MRRAELLWFHFVKMYWNAKLYSLPCGLAASESATDYLNMLCCHFMVDGFVKSQKLGWSCEKLHMRGAEIFIYFGVPGYVEINEYL